MGAEFWVQSVIQFIVAFVAAGAGAISAFTYQEEKEIKKQNLLRLASINRCIHALVSQHLAIDNYYFNMLKKFKDKDEYIQHLPVFSFPEIAWIDFDMKELLWLIEEKSGRELYGGVLVALTRLYEKKKLIQDVVDFRLHTIGPIMDDVAKTGRDLNYTELVERIGITNAIHLEVRIGELHSVRERDFANLNRVIKGLKEMSERALNSSETLSITAELAS